MNKNTYNKGVVQPDDNIIFESRPDFGVEKKIEEETKTKNKCPKIPLVFLEDTVIKTTNEEGRITLLQILECAGWKWNIGDKPTNTSKSSFLHTKKNLSGYIYLHEPSELNNYYHITHSSEESVKKDMSINNQLKIIPAYEYYFKHLEINIRTIKEVQKYFKERDE